MASQKGTIIDNAQQFAAKGKIDKAIAEWKKLLAETPQDGNIYNNISDLYLRVNDKKSAIDACLKAAAVYREAGFELKGVAVLKKILKIDSNRIDIYEMLADTSADRGLTGNAVEGYQQTASLYIKNGNFKGAVGVYQKLVRFTPQDPEIPLAIARLYQKQDRYREAILSYEQAMAIYENKKMVSEAHQVVEEIIKIDPAYLKQIAAKEANLASIGAMGAERDITLSSPKKITESPKLPPQFVKEETKDEEPFFAEEMDIFRDITPSQMPLPVLNTERQNGVDLRDAYKKEKEPHGVSDAVLGAHLSEAESYLKYGLTQNAVEKFLLVRELAPMREEAYLGLKEVYLKEGQNDKAAIAGFALLDVYEKMGAFDKKETLLKELHEIDPNGEYRKIAEEGRSMLSGSGAFPLQAQEDIQPSFENGIPLKDISLSLNQEKKEDRLFLQKMRDTDFETFADLSEPAFLQGIPPLDIDLTGEEALGVKAPSEQREREGDALQALPVKGEALAPVVDESFDLASAVAQEIGDLAADPSAIIYRGSPPRSGSKDGVTAPVAVRNEKRQQYLETCYHLGIAQKEMGNFAKAIREFEQVLAGEGRFQEVLSMLAQCYAEQGDVVHAANVLQEGLNDPRCKEGVRFAVLYDLASIYEQLGEKEKSFPLYKEIYRSSPNFRDVSGKVKEIPYRKSGSENVRARESSLFASEDASIKDKSAGSALKGKRRVSYV